MIVAMPSLISLIINAIIFKYVRSSTNRVEISSAVANNNQHRRINRRDLHLLRHMITMFCVFVGGWGPVYMYSLISPETPNIIVNLTFIILAELAILFDIINLFLYNHELRRYLFEKIFIC
jgi:hypothetical protein